MNTLDIKSQSKMFDALGCPSRLKIFLLLRARKRLCVTEIAKAADLSMSATSHQLSRLEAAGLVVGRRAGRLVCYEFNETPLSATLCTCLGFCRTKARKVAHVT